MARLVAKMREDHLDARLIAYSHQDKKPGLQLDQHKALPISGLYPFVDSFCCHQIAGIRRYFTCAIYVS